MRHLKFLGILLTGLLTAQLLYAGAGTTGAVVLKESIGARATAMGDAYVGIASGADAIFWNPAGLAEMKTREIGAMYLKDVADIDFETINYVQPLPHGQAVAIAIERLSAGNLEINYLDGTSRTVNAQSDFVYNAAYAKQILDNLSAGANFKLLSSNLAETETASAYAVDLAVLYKLATVKGLSMGANIQNIGSGIKYISETDPLPLNVKVGAAYRTEVKNDVLTVAADFNKPKELSSRVNLGFEYLYNKIMAFRAGYKIGYDLDTFTAGFGFKIGNYGLDYAFAPKGDLGNNHRLSFSLNF